ncbi:MAG: hypothetical protein PHU85_11515 [Phycisphaerae bacterium]|nr:hypothetical protein [Phycisphaerae bacterium]
MSTPAESALSRSPWMHLHFIAMCVLVCAGSWAAFDREDSFLRGWTYPHHQPDPRMNTIKESLQNFRREHGRYPSNDEGLATLEYARMASVPLDYTLREDRLTLSVATRDDRCPPRGTEAENYFDVVSSLNSHWNGNWTRSPLDDVGGVYSATLRCGFGRWWFLPLGPGGIYDDAMIPYLYENRSGFARSAFEFSPVDDDTAGEFSVRVDDGIHVYSLTDKFARDAGRAEYWKHNRTRIAGLGMVFLAAFLLVWRYGRKPSRLILGLVLMVLPPALLVMGNRTWTTCYYWVRISRRTPTALAAQRDLLTKYHAAGVIGEAAYKRSLDGLDLDKVLVPMSPSTQPATKE